MTLGNFTICYLIVLESYSNPQNSAHLLVCNEKKIFGFGFFVGDVIT